MSEPQLYTGIEQVVREGIAQPVDAVALRPCLLAASVQAMKATMLQSCLLLLSVRGVSTSFLS